MPAPRPEERLHAARQRYLATLAHKADDLLAALAESTDQLRALSHRLAGSAGLHQLPQIAAQARALEALCRAGAGREALEARVEELTRALRAASVPRSPAD